MTMKQYYVYIMTNRKKTLYTGMTGDLAGRVFQHKQGEGSIFTAKYKITRLAYYEEFQYVNDAITQEKQIKGWVSAKKLKMIESTNPDWIDISADWY